MLAKTLVLLGLTAYSTACTTAHVLMTNCALDGDIVSLQIWDNEVRVCNGGKTINGASKETVYKFDCGGGKRAEVTSNGGKVTYWNDEKNYQAELQVVEGADPHSYVCGQTDTVNINGMEYEYVFSDKYADCAGKAQPQLCDYKSYCEDGKGGGPGGSQSKRSLIFTA